MSKKKKILILCAIIFVLIIIFLGITILKKGKGIVVLMYHGVDDQMEELNTPCENFEKQMKYLSDHHYETIFIEDIYKDHKGKKTIALTFDDGYENFYQNVFPLLKKYNLKANLYIITSAIGKKGYLKEEQIKEISDSGLVSIGSHTVNHTPLTYFGEVDILKELDNSKTTLEQITGKEVKTISYPTGDYDEYIIDLSKNYYEYGVTTEAKTNFLKQGNKQYEISRYGIGKDTPMRDFKKVVLHSSIHRF